MWRHRISVLLAVLLLALSILSESPTYAATDLGGLKLTEYCKVHHSYRGVGIFKEAWAVLLPPKEAYSWKCQVYQGTYTGPSVWVGDYDIDTNAVCREQYPGVGAWSKTSNPRDAFSWRCYR